MQDLKDLVKSLKSDAIQAASILKEDLGIDPDLSLYNRLKESDFQRMINEVDLNEVIDYIVQMEKRRLRR